MRRNKTFNVKKGATSKKKPPKPEFGDNPKKKLSIRKKVGVSPNHSDRSRHRGQRGRS